MSKVVNEKAVAVARDVLKYLDSLEFTTSNYLEIPDTLSVPGEGDLKDCVDVVQKGCRVCLLGACLLSKSRLFDEVPLKDLFNHFLYHPTRYITDRNTYRLLESVFSRDQMTMMESAFQQDSWFAIQEKVETRLAEDSQDFGSRYDNKADRARAVMENVIANGGVFIPSQVPQEVSDVTSV